MEYIELFKELINSVGFPIAMVIYFIWDKNKSNDKMMDSLKESTQLMSSTLAHNTESLTKNTTILEKLLTKLGIEDI